MGGEFMMRGNMRMMMMSILGWEMNLATEQFSIGVLTQSSKHHPFRCLISDYHDDDDYDVDAEEDGDDQSRASTQKEGQRLLVV